MCVSKKLCSVPNSRNLEAPEVPVYSVKGHKEIINTIDGVGGLGIGEGAPEIVTGSRDGKSEYSVYIIIIFFLVKSLCNNICGSLPQSLTL